MWWVNDTINVVQWLTGTEPEVQLFNYMFTLIVVFGMIAWGIGLLCKLISQS